MLSVPKKSIFGLFQAKTYISQKQIQKRIFTFRREQAMLDRDLAAMYQVQVKRLNEQVKRNSERFPKSFRFQLSDDKKTNWSQIATGSNP